MASGDMFPNCSECHQNVMVCECDDSPGVALSAGIAKVQEAAVKIAPTPTPEQLEQKAQLLERLQAKLKTQISEAQVVGQACGKLSGFIMRERAQGHTVIVAIGFVDNYGDGGCNPNMWSALVTRPKADVDGFVVYDVLGEGVSNSPIEAVALAIQRFDAQIAEMAASNEKQNAEGVESVG
jgi:hypothetical protein